MPQKIFKEILARTLRVIPDIYEKSVELFLTNDEEIRKLNFSFRGKNSPTDVLSFGERDIGKNMNFPGSSSFGKSLGQIIISLDRAVAQAEDLNQSFEEELRFLFTHGLLHLLGFDHENPADEKVMLGKAYKILGRQSRGEDE